MISIRLSRSSRSATCERNGWSSGTLTRRPLSADRETRCVVEVPRNAPAARTCARRPGCAGRRGAGLASSMSMPSISPRSQCWCAEAVRHGADGVVRRCLQHVVLGVGKRRFGFCKRLARIHQVDDAGDVDPVRMTLLKSLVAKRGPTCSMLSRTTMPPGRIRRAVQSRSNAANSSSWLPSIRTRS